jgi:hypothetical protein
MNHGGMKYNRVVKIGKILSSFIRGVVEQQQGDNNINNNRY